MILYVANRGEIASRIIRSAKKLGIRTIVGFADPDRDLPFVAEANESHPLHGTEPKETYLHMEKVLSVARKAGATHVHPGYGFLSENPQFVDAVEMEGLQFVGPSSDAMRLLGDKIGSRRFLKTHDISLLPCYDGDDQHVDRLLIEAKHLGFPLLIKPSAGGGGKGMFRIDSIGEFREKLESSQRIAKAAFGDDRVFLERMVDPARHIEVQILADKKGNVRAIGERECSLQRRHQKVIEEAPCIFLSEKLRKKIFEMSETIAREAKYSSAGTVEWIWDGGDGIYFLEVNARIQVEHPVTEETTGIDLIEWQLRIAGGETIQNLEFKRRGHSIEARLCAEDPSQDFLPSGGKILKLQLAHPDEARSDMGYREGNIIDSSFDSLMGKIIVRAETRDGAIEKLKRVLESMWIAGPKTNRSYVLKLLQSDAFQSGKIFTGFIQNFRPTPPIREKIELIKMLSTFQTGSAAVEMSEEDADLDWYSPWGAIPQKNSTAAASAIDWLDRGDYRYIHTKFEDWSIPRPRAQGSLRGGAAGDSAVAAELRSPMPAKVIRILVSIGEAVRKGQPLLVLEAMKMEHQVKAPYDGKVETIACKESERVAVDSVLIRMEDRGAKA